VVRGDYDVGLVELTRAPQQVHDRLERVVHREEGLWRLLRPAALRWRGAGVEG
jgi:hypothetical protein